MTGVIFVNRDLLRLEHISCQIGHCRTLGCTDFQQHSRTRTAHHRTLIEQAADQVQAICAAIKCQTRFMAADHQIRQFVAGDIGQVCHHQVHTDSGPDERIEQITMQELNGGMIQVRVLTGDGQRFRADVGGVNPAGWPVGGEGYGQCTAAGATINHCISADG